MKKCKDCNMQCSGMCGRDWEPPEEDDSLLIIVVIGLCLVVWCLV